MLLQAYPTLPPPHSTGNHESRLGIPFSKWHKVVSLGLGNTQALSELFVIWSTLLETILEKKVLSEAILSSSNYVSDFFPFSHLCESFYQIITAEGVCVVWEPWTHLMVRLLTQEHRFFLSLKRSLLQSAHLPTTLTDWYSFIVTIIKMICTCHTTCWMTSISKTYISCLLTSTMFTSLHINHNGKLKEYLFLPRVQSLDLTLPKYEGNSRKIKRQNIVKKR